MTRLKKHILRNLLGGLLTSLGLILLFLAFAEGVFLERVVFDGVGSILSNGFNGGAEQLANYLVANGRISYLSSTTKIILGLTSIVSMYFGLSLIVNAKNTDFSIKNFFSYDYWVRFDAIRYTRTKTFK